VTHPHEFSRALSAASGLPFGAACPRSFRREDKRTDLRFTTVDGGEVLIEAKIDDFVTVDQIDRYRREFPEAMAILLVPSADAVDVREVLSERESVRVATWSAVLGELALTNPVAGQVLSDVTLLADMPGSKSRVRRLMNDAVRGVSSRAVRVQQGVTSSRLPSIEVSVDETWVFGQVESARQFSDAPSFQAKVGFAVGESDAADADSRRRMHDALVQAWTSACALEAVGGVQLSRSRAPSRQQATFSVDEPFQARGYRDSYVGVATVRTESAGEALDWAVSLAERFAPISGAVWGSAGERIE
jgi:hypothetical protein